jgi:uncharacterized protein affecting Mg2+/Co2+ transport
LQRALRQACLHLPACLVQFLHGSIEGNTPWCCRASISPPFTSSLRLHARVQGSMEGEYTMVALSEDVGEWKDTIEVKIGKFVLEVEGPIMELF